MLESISSSSTITLSVCCMNKPGGCSFTSLPVLTPSIHQISTLEKTNSCQHSFLSSLMSKRPLQVSLFLDAAQSTSSEVPGLCDAVEASTSGVLSLHGETKFIIGFDFAVTLSSLASFCDLFGITSEQLLELKWQMLNKHKR